MKDLLSKENRNYLMGIAIIWIITLHIYMYGFDKYEYLRLFFSKGYLGVDIFFLLSAYGLCWSLNTSTTIEFYKKRFNRLFPVYPIFLIFLIAFFGSYYPYSSLQLFFYQITGLSNFYMIDLEWYIPALIVIYALFPIIYRLIKMCHKYSDLIVYILLLILTIALPVYTDYIRELFASRLWIIVVGIMTYIYSKENELGRLCCLYLYCAMLKITLNTGSDSLYIPLVLLAIGRLPIRKLPLHKFLSFCGKHSLEIYLAQNFTLNHFYAQCDNVPFYLKFMLILPMIFVISAVLSKIQKVNKLVCIHNDHSEKSN